MGETIAQNRRARHEFTIEDTFEAGIVLPARRSRASAPARSTSRMHTRASSATRPGSSAPHIAPWEQADAATTTSRSGPRKLLLHRDEIDELLGKTKAKGLTLVPLRLYLTAGQGEAGARAGPRQAAPRPAARHRRARRPPRDRRARGRGAPPLAALPADGIAQDVDEQEGAPMRLARMIQAVDLHACGEPGRVIVGGVLDVPGDTMFDKMPLPRRRTPTGCASACSASRAAIPAANCNLILPSIHPDADAGYVIMEQVEYPGMSGTNTICVVTALLETGMLPMNEPVTELDARGAGRADPRPRRLRGRQGHRRHLPQRARVRDPPRHARRGARTSARSPSTSPTAACSTSSPTPRRFGLRLTPDEGARHRAHQRDDQGGGRASSCRSSTPSSRASPASRIAQLSGPAARPGERDAGTRHVSTGDARLGAAVDLDGRDRPLAVRHGHVREDGDPPREGPARARRGLPARGHPRHGVHGPARGGDAGRRSRRVVPTLTGTAWITGFATTSSTRRSVPRGLHGRRHLGLSASGSIGIRSMRSPGREASCGSPNVGASESRERLRTPSATCTGIARRPIAGGSGG